MGSSFVDDGKQENWQRVAAAYAQAGVAIDQAQLAHAAAHTRSPQFDARELSALYRWMPFVNYLGFPAIVFPVGFDRRNRPVSIQAIARPYGESALLSFAYQIERARHAAAGFPAAASRVS